MTRAQLIAAGCDPAVIDAATGPAPAEKGPRKYRNVPTEYRGIVYDSKAEARRAAELDLLVAAGEVVRWERQPRFQLGCPENVYVADMLVTTRDGKHVEDVKGKETPKFRRDKRLWRAYGPHPLWIIKGKAVEVIEGGGRS